MVVAASTAATSNRSSSLQIAVSSWLSLSLNGSACLPLGPLSSSVSLSAPNNESVDLTRIFTPTLGFLARSASTVLLNDAGSLALAGPRLASSTRVETFIAPATSGNLIQLLPALSAAISPSVFGGGTALGPSVPSAPLPARV